MLEEEEDEEEEEEEVARVKDEVARVEASAAKASVCARERPLIFCGETPRAGGVSARSWATWRHSKRPTRGVRHAQTSTKGTTRCPRRRS